MAARRIPDDNLINSIVGPGTFLRGHIELSGLLRIDGDFSGSLKSDGRVIIGQAGRADCAIEAGTVVIGGIFRGEILATEKVVLLSSAVVIGTISSPRLVAEDGVLLSGRFQVTGSVDNLPPGNLTARRKELLLESVRTREASKASPEHADDAGASADEPVPDDSGNSADLPAARGGGVAWNG